MDYNAHFLRRKRLINPQRCVVQPCRASGFAKGVSRPRSGAVFGASGWPEPFTLIANWAEAVQMPILSASIATCPTSTRHKLADAPRFTLPHRCGRPAKEADTQVRQGAAAHNRCHSGHGDAPPQSALAGLAREGKTTRDTIQVSVEEQSAAGGLLDRVLEAMSPYSVKSCGPLGGRGDPRRLDVR